MLAVLLGISISACNSNEEPTEEKEYLSTKSVAITNFSLSADIRVMKNLDSVYFSIDLEHGVVFNADSLPKGTKITKLVPKISYPSSVTSAVIEMTGGEHRTGTVNYTPSSTDTIDFTGDVMLTLKAGNDIEKKYRLKVNVHKTDPDTLYWDRTSSMSLPSRMPAPKAQKTVAYGSGTLSIIEESDGSYTLATTSDVFSGEWQKRALSLGFTPVLEGLTATPAGELFMLSDAGDLMQSADGEQWQQAAADWTAVIGMYGDTLLGTSLRDGKLMMTCWPAGKLPETEMPTDFPLSGFTAPIEFSNRWTPDPTIVIFGGYPYRADGKSGAWAFDGSQWADIASSALPALSGMSVVKYYSYLNSATNGLLREFEVYLAFGGITPQGRINDTVYISYDHGINWQRAPEFMQLPEGVHAGYMPDVVALGTSMQSALSSRWKVSADRRRLPYQIDGDLVKWECPYLFIFGGCDAGMNLYDRIRAGVLQRLTYVPLF